MTSTSTIAQLPERGPGRLFRIGGSLLVAFVIIFSAWWIAGRQGIDDLGNAGMNANLLPAVGEVAPDFTAPNPLGQLYTLSEFRGQPVWLNFWGSWCPPCRAEMPDMQAAFAQVQPQGVVLLAVSLDEPALAAQQFAARNNATFTILSDPDRSATGGAYPIYNFPTHIFINRDGTVQRVVLNVMSAEEAVQYAQEIINS